MSNYSRKDNNSTNYEHPNESNLWELHKAMDYNHLGRPVVTVDDDTVEHTATNRRKISRNTVTVYNTSQYDTAPSIWDEAITGTAFSVYNQYTGSTELNVGTTPGDEIIRQTKLVVPYTPGRQNELAIGLRLAAEDTGMRFRAGLFNDTDGCFFELDQGVFYCVLRRGTATGPIETRVPQSEWNVDKLDGTGVSSLQADILAQQALLIEYEWTGGGQIEFAFLINNNKYPVHQFRTTNVFRFPYMTTPYLPVRVEVTNVSSTDAATGAVPRLFLSTMAISTEGDSTDLGNERNATSPIIGRSVTTANVFYPILSVRLKDNRLNGVANVVSFQAAALDNSSIFYQIIKNAPLTGAVWETDQADNFAEHDHTATAVDIDSGEIIKTGYISPNGQGETIPLSLYSRNQIGRQNMGSTSDVITIAIASVGANKSVFASINWVEIR